MRFLIKELRGGTVSGRDRVLKSVLMSAEMRYDYIVKSDIRPKRKTS